MRDSSWALEVESQLWTAFKKWDQKKMRSEFENPKFVLDSIECRDTLCLVDVHYRKDYAIHDQVGEVDAMVSRTMPKCGFTSIGFEKDALTHEWFLHCDGMKQK